MPDPPRDLLPANPPRRLSFLLGVLLALLIAASFSYPPAAYPFESLAIGAVMLIGGFGLAIRLLAGKNQAGPDLLEIFGGLPLLAGFGFIFWAVLRWNSVAVPAAGRDWVISLLWLGVALIMGAASAAFCLREIKEPVVFTTLRRLLILAAAGFALLGLYQYFIGYGETLKLLRSELNGSAANLQTQGVIHALSERRVAGRLGNPNLFAAQLSVLAVFCLSVFSRGEPRPWRWVGGLSYALALATLLLTKSRGGLLSFGLASALASALAFFTWRGNWLPRHSDIFRARARARARNRNRKDPGIQNAASRLSFSKGNIDYDYEHEHENYASPYWGLIVLPVLTLLWTTALLINHSWAAHEGVIQRLANLTTIRERLFYWAIAWKVWKSHPWIGEGPGGFSLLYLTLKSPMARESQYAHSWLFQSGAELGLIGLILIILFWGALTARLLANSRILSKFKEGKPTQELSETRWFLLALLVLAINGLFEFSLQWRPFLITTGLLTGVACAANPTPFLRHFRRRIAGAAVCAMAAVVGVLALILTPPYHLAEHYRWLGEVALENREWDQAAASYGKAARLIPDDASLLVAQSGALGRLGEPVKAWALLDKAARLNPYSASIHSVQAQMLIEQGQPAEALRQLGEAIGRYPSNVGYRLKRAELLIGLGRPADACADIAYIEQNQCPIWEIEYDPYNTLRRRLGRPTIAFGP